MIYQITYKLNNNMKFIFRIKRRLTGDSGSPDKLQTGELAYNEVDGTLYIGVSQQNNTFNLSCSNISLSSN
jgi:hypothetical protein